MASSGMSVCEETQWSSDTAVASKRGGGGTRSRMMVLSVGGVIGCLSESFTVDMPTIRGPEDAYALLVATARVLWNRPASGSMSLTMRGSHFGAVSWTTAVRVGPSGCESTEWTSDTLVRCRGGQAVGGSLRASVSAGTATGSATEGLSAMEGSLSSSQRQNMGASGSVSVTIYGSGFELGVESGSARMSWSSCESSRWVSDTSLQCRTGRQDGGSQRAAVTMGGQQGSATESVSADRTSLSAVWRHNVVSTGSGSVTVYGSGLGLSWQTVGAGVGVSGSEASVWESESGVRCRASAGTGGSRTVYTTVNLMHGSMTTAVSSDGLVMSVAARANVGSTGSLSVTLLGAGLTPRSYTVVGRLGGPSGCEASLWGSDTSMIVRGGGGSGRSGRALITAGQRVGSMSVATSYGTQGLSGALASNVAGSTGSVSVTVHGARMGVWDPTSTLRSGRSSCEGSEWVSDSTVRCRTGQMVRGTRRTSVTSGTTIGSVTEGVSVGTMAASTVRVSNVAGSTGSGSITVIGSNVGVSTYTARVVGGESGCEASTWVSSSSVACRVSSSGRSSRRVSATAGEVSGSVTAGLSVSAGAMSSIRASNAAASGSVVVTVQGAGMALSAVCGAAGMGWTGCEATWWESDTSMQCRGTAGIGSSRAAVVSAGLRVGSVSEAVSLAAGMASDMLGSNGATTGSASVTMYGAGMGSRGYTGVVSLGHSMCESSSWFSDSSIFTRFSDSLFLSQRLSLSVGNFLVSSSHFFSFDATKMSISILASNKVSTGSCFLSISGLGFGKSTSTGTVRFLSSAFESSRWSSDTAVACKYSAGLLRSGRISFTAGSSGSVSEGFSFGTPLLSNIAGFNVASSGAIWISVIGSSMGMSDISSICAVGGSIAESTVWFGDTSVVCLISDILKGSRAFAVSSGIQVGSRSHALSTALISLSIGGRQNAVSTGAVLISLYGAGFGYPGLSASVATSFSVCMTTKWIADSGLTCLISEGSSRTARTTLTVGEVLGTSTLILSYAESSISMSLKSNFLSTGALRLTLYGSGFGAGSMSTKSQVSYSGCEYSLWISDTATLAKLSQGAKKSLRTSFTQSSNVGSITSIFSCLPGSLSEAHRSNIFLTGSLQITVLGDQFGLFDISIQVRIQVTAVESSTWVSDTSVSGFVAQGGKISRKSTITVGDNYGSMSTGLSYSSAVLSLPIMHNAHGSASLVLTLFGSAISLKHSTQAARLGESSCEMSTWLSQSSILCKSVQSVIKSRMTTISVGNVRGSLSNLISFAIPNICSPGTSNFAGTGSSRFTIYGASLGEKVVSNMCRQALTSCEASFWIGNTALVCKAANSLALSNHVRVTLGDVVGSMSSTVSVDIMQVSSLTFSNAAATGASVLTVQGSKFGFFSFSQSVSANSRSQSGLWISDSAMLCRISSGSGASHRVVLTASSLISSTTVLFSFLMPTVSRILPSNIVTTSSSKAILHGNMLGFYDSTHQTRLGLTSVMTIAWTSDSSLQCMLESGLRRSLRLSISASLASVGSISEAVTYDELNLLLYWAYNFPTSGAATFTVTGLGFGIDGDCPAIHNGFTQATSSLWISDSTCNCKLASGISGTRRNSLTAGKSIGSMSESLSLSASILSSVVSFNSVATGSIMATLQGSGLGLTSQSATTRAGLSTCEFTVWRSDSSVSCFSISVSKSSRSLVSTSGEQLGTFTASLSVDLPVITTAKPGNFATRPSVILTIYGENMAGSFDVSPKVSLHFTLCESSVWISDTSLSTKVHSGISASRQFTLSAGLFSGCISNLVSYCKIFVSVAMKSNSPSSGSKTLLVYGHHLGTAVSNTLLARIVQTVSELTMWTSDTCVRVSFSAGFSRSRAFIITAGNIFGSTSDSLTFSSLALCAVQKSNFASTGTISVTLIGSMFGKNTASTHANIGSTVTESSIWASDTSMKALTSEFSRKSQRTLLSVNSRQGSMTAALSTASYLSSLRSVNSASSASLSLTVLGMNLGISVQSGISSIAATSCESSFWLSETSVSCLLSRQADRSTRFLFTLSSAVGTLSDAFSTAAGNLCQVQRRNQASTGSSFFSIMGSHFSVQGLSVQLRVSFTVCETSLWISDSAMSCRDVTNGFFSRILSLTVGGQSGSVSGILSSDLVVLSTMKKMNILTTGSSSLTLYGSDFGQPDISLHARMQTVCESSDWKSDTSVYCSISALRLSSKLVIVSAGIARASASQTLSFDAAELAQFSAVNTLSKGVVTTVYGSGFLSFSYSVSGRLGSTGCESTVWESATTISCQLSQGSRKSGYFILTAGSRFSTATDVISFDEPSLWDAALSRYAVSAVICTCQNVRC